MPVAQDIQVALTVLGRRDPAQDNATRIDLTGACLHKPSSVGAHLRAAVFVDATISDADFRRADLTDADLTDAILVDRRWASNEKYFSVPGVGTDFRDATWHGPDCVKWIVTPASSASP